MLDIDCTFADELYVKDLDPNWLSEAEGSKFDRKTATGYLHDSNDIKELLKKIRELEYPNGMEFKNRETFELELSLYSRNLLFRIINEKMLTGQYS